MLVVMCGVRACVLSLLCSVPGRGVRLGRLSELGGIISCLVPVLRFHGCCCIVGLLEVIGYAALRGKSGSVTLDTNGGTVEESWELCL
jgi:hypothetical protein